MHQRVWALEHELDTIVWTFDPLVRRNAVLNLIKLGVDVRGFEVNFYGAMDDGINAGDPTDRLFAWWRLQSPRAVSALRGELSRIDVAGERAAGRDLREIPLPDDIVGLRSSDPASAGEWRLTVREALSRDLVDGYGIVGVSTGGGYVLERVS
jgi:predicted GNAT superfamily acetyltransferase